MSSGPDQHPSQVDPRAAWHRLLQVSNGVLRELDKALDHHDRISVTEFDVLITLDNAPGIQLRMTDLARAALLSSGGMTRLATRLEVRGLLRRDPDPDDARAFQATLTPEGQRKLAQARITHDAVLTRMLAPHMTPKDVQGLERTLDKIINNRDA